MSAPVATPTLSAADIRFDLSPAPWQDAKPIVDVAVDTLPDITDLILRDLIALLVEAIAELRERVQALQEVQSETMTLLSAAHWQAANARRRLAERMRADRRAS